MTGRLIVAALAMCIAAGIAPAGSARDDRTASHGKRTDCTENGDRRYMICPGAWSAKAVPLFNTWMAPDENPGRRLDLRSPDGEKIIEVRGFHVRLVVNGKRYWTPFGRFHDAEVGWAPDSTRLYVTWSETGQLGRWYTYFYDVTETGLVPIHGVTGDVRPDMIRRMQRAAIPKWVETPQALGMWKTLDYCSGDIVGSQWLNGSTEILVAALAGPDSGCKYMGNYAVYRIEVATGNILQVYSAREAQRAFGKENLPGLDDDLDGEL